MQSRWFSPRASHRRRSRPAKALSTFEADERPPIPDRIRVTGHSDVTLFFACDDVAAAYTQLRAHNVAACTPSITHYGMKAITFKDPDGYEICLQQTDLT